MSDEIGTTCVTDVLSLQDLSSLQQAVKRMAMVAKEPNRNDKVFVFFIFLKFIWLMIFYDLSVNFCVLCVSVLNFSTEDAKKHKDLKFYSAHNAHP
jgi:hypothetical protein